MRKFVLTVLLFGLVLFSACGSSQDTEEEPINDENEVGLDEDTEADNDKTSTDSEQTEDNTDTTDKTDSDSTDRDESASKDNEAEDPEAEIIKTGSYNGQADPHTIEVETDEGPVAYQLTMEARDLVVDLEPGDKVTYTYYKDGEMLVIKHIEKVD